MQNRNPYAAPKANVAGGDVGDEDYGEIKIFSAQGRIGRVRYIGYSMALTLLAWILIGISAAVAVPIGQSALVLVVALGYVAFLVVQFLFNIQRSHDMNVTGWLSLIWLLPFGLFAFWFVPGTRGENDYGKRPPPNSAGVIILACLAPLVTAGILAAIAVPAYQDYTIRAQVSEGLNMASGPKAAVMEVFSRTRAAPANRLEAGLSAEPTDSGGLYVESVDVASGTIVVTYRANANAAIAGSVLAIRPYVMPDNRVAWRCGQGPVPDGAVAMDAQATPFTTDIMARYLPSACRP
jgi:type IV pilus assembly protein PilA